MRADRALSGRLVCTSCGNPYGVRKVGRNKINDFNFFQLFRRYWLFFSLLVFVFVLVVI